MGQTRKEPRGPDLSGRKSYGSLPDAKVREGKLKSGATYKVRREAVPRGKVTTSTATRPIAHLPDKMHETRTKLVNHRGQIENKSKRFTTTPVSKTPKKK